ncbi:sugar ABC transporter ATP-binding protein [Catalinimonas niigatensis]|uniref:sugar ABC transporter ATP-binding protein n=1 Tax=Catalinimonas niigatensis TaxID=1397264 RepID=UPI002666BBCE|nr:sugar ABC transporter ATP-binding protein [Catalinimonas niigatensis]WPP50957.1 sugar ABC transporter ATP-binding protein [Catalinimonas niigatensis]
MKEISLEVKRISKYFPGVKALDEVSMEIRKGEVHALCGENGAGKSTLMNVLSGNTKPDQGHILLHGKEVNIFNQMEAQRLGIAIVYQERSLVENLSVAENIYTTNKPRNRWGWIDFPQLYQNTQHLLDRLNIGEIRPKMELRHLSAAQQQMVEIAKALSQNPQFLILDEPTASITETETHILFKIIRDLSKVGVSVIYISHRMAEIFDIADRVTVLKDGKYQGTRNVAETNVDEIIRMMVGRQLEKHYFQSYTREKIVLEVKNLSGMRFRDVSFQLREGEILALAGLVGAGRTEVARTIMGADKKMGGEIYWEGKKVNIAHPQTATELGMGYLPEERKSNGLFLDMSVEDNIISAYLTEAAEKGFIQHNKVKQAAEKYIQMLRIMTPGSRQKVIHLSGGNQQKVVLAKWLLREPKVFMVDEPTHGVDVGAKSEIYSILKELTRQGVAILLISSELPEVLALSDRILVMWNGQLTAELSRDEASEEEIIHYASGTKMMFA